MNTKIDNLKSNEETRSSIKKTILILSFTVLMIVSAHIRIPVAPIPFTLQTFVVILSAFVIKNRSACISQILYLTYGLAGAAVFTYGGGIGYLLSPTFGYIIGFVVMAYILGYMTEKNKENLTFKTLVFIGFAGVLVQLTIGTIYLYVLSNTVLGTNLSLITALTSGLLIFIPHEIIKVAVAAIISRKIG